MAETQSCPICFSDVDGAVCPPELASRRPHAAGDPEEPQATIVTPCQHCFHHLCLESWMRWTINLGQDFACPVCRKPIPPTVTAAIAEIMRVGAPLPPPADPAEDPAGGGVRDPAVAAAAARELAAFREERDRLEAAVAPADMPVVVEVDRDHDRLTVPRKLLILASGEPRDVAGSDTGVRIASTSLFLDDNRRVTFASVFINSNYYEFHNLDGWYNKGLFAVVVAVPEMHTVYELERYLGYPVKPYFSGDRLTQIAAALQRSSDIATRYRFGDALKIDPATREPVLMDPSSLASIYLGRERHNLRTLLQYCAEMPPPWRIRRALPHIECDSRARTIHVPRKLLVGVGVRGHEEGVRPNTIVHAPEASEDPDFTGSIYSRERAPYAVVVAVPEISTQRELEEYLGRPFYASPWQTVASWVGAVKLCDIASNLAESAAIARPFDVGTVLKLKKRSVHGRYEVSGMLRDVPELLVAGEARSADEIVRSASANAPA